MHTVLVRGETERVDGEWIMAAVGITPEGRPSERGGRTGEKRVTHLLEALSLLVEARKSGGQGGASNLSEECSLHLFPTDYLKLFER